MNVRIHTITHAKWNTSTCAPLDLISRLYSYNLCWYTIAPAEYRLFEYHVISCRRRISLGTWISWNCKKKRWLHAVWSNGQFLKLYKPHAVFMFMFMFRIYIRILYCVNIILRIVKLRVNIEKSFDDVTWQKWSALKNKIHGGYQKSSFWCIYDTYENKVSGIRSHNNVIRISRSNV